MHALAAAILACVPRGDAPPREAPELWLYASTNLQVADNVEKLGALLDRAGKAGYARMVLADSKLARLGTVPDVYFANARRLIERARAARVALVPAIFPMGYSNALLFHDPNLAEALPVRKARFVVKEGHAAVDARPLALTTPKWKDDAWQAEGAAADGATAGAWRCRDPKGGNARVVFEVALEPWQLYHLALTVEAKEFGGTPEAKVLVGDRSLCFSGLGCKATQAATRHHVLFHSQEVAHAAIYLGAWGATGGELAVRDVTLEHAGLVNLVRRDGAPFEVATADGRLLVEGRDYEPVADPRCGQLPWPGEYDVWHEPPSIAVALPDGTALDVSFHSVVTIHDGQVMACPSEPRTLELLADEVKRVRDLFGGDAFLLSHDEIRVVNQDESCRRRGLDAGALLADHARACVGLARAAAPDAELWIWSDMFDPNHNARAGYYLVRGDLAGAWEGLDRGVGVACWHFDQRGKSLPFFAKRGHPLLLAAYYDVPADQVAAQVEGWLDAADAAGGARAVMYTTWKSDYGELEPFADAVRARRRRR